jgi:hypothetical protein
LERALNDAKADLDHDMSLFRDVMELKAERDALRRDVGSGTVWLSETSSDQNLGLATYH